MFNKKKTQDLEARLTSLELTLEKHAKRLQDIELFMSMQSHINEITNEILDDLKNEIADSKENNVVKKQPVVKKEKKSKKK